MTYLQLIHTVPCVVCTHMGLPQAGPTFAHHVESVRDEHSDYAAAALCYDHHQGPNGVHTLSRGTFAMRYKLTNVDLIALTVKALDVAGRLH